jgi:rubrerythrin
MDAKNLLEVIQFALEKEKEAVEFYQYCSDQAKRPEMKEAFLEMKNEESKHVRMLQNFKPQQIDRINIKQISDMKISDYLVDMEFKPDMSYQDLLVLAMKREESAYRMYQNLGKESEDASMVKMFQILAQEELKHKNRLQKEYDDYVLQWN